MPLITEELSTLFRTSALRCFTLQEWPNEYVYFAKPLCRTQFQYPALYNTCVTCSSQVCTTTLWHLR